MAQVFPGGGPLEVRRAGTPLPPLLMDRNLALESSVSSSSGVTQSSVTFKIRDVEEEKHHGDEGLKELFRTVQAALAVGCALLTLALLLAVGFLRDRGFF